MVLQVKRGAAPEVELQDDKQTTETAAAEVVDTSAAASVAEQVAAELETAADEAVVEAVAEQVADEDPVAEASAEEPAAQEAAAEEPAATVEPEAEVVVEAVVETVAEQQQAQAEQSAATSSTTAVATQNQTTAVAAATGSAGAENYFRQLISEMEEEGQEGLEMGFGVFPLISLDKGEFKVGDDDLGDDDFEGVPLMSRPKFAYRTVGVAEKEADVIFADTDKEHLDKNSAVSLRLLEWKEKFPSSSWEVKQYQDVFMYLTKMPAKPELEGQLVQLSVAPTSVKLYTRVGLTVKGKGYKLHECVIRCGVGEKIRGEFDYYPWAFTAVGSCKKLGVTVNFGQTKDEDF